MSLFFKFLLCSCFVIATQARSVAEIRAWFMSLGLECNEEHPITPDEMLQLQQHKIPDSANTKCLLACVYRKANWLDSKGIFDIENANKMVEKEHIDDPTKLENSKKLFEICKKVNEESVTDGDKGCERAASLAKCLIVQSPKMGFDLIM